MAEVYLGVGIDASEARTGASQFNSATDSISKGAKKASKSTADFKRQLAYAKAALIAFGVVAATQTIRVITEYTSALSSAKAVTGATATQMKQLEQATRQMGATTMFSASAAAEAVKFLGMAGFETSEILEALPSTLDLAAAASLNMGQAADIASNIMSGFGIEASKMAEVADTLSAVASNANTDVTQMGQAMKYVGPIAKSLDISMQDTAAAIGVLSNAGIQGSMAGTGLKTSLAGLLNPSKKARESIQSLGLTVDELNPKSQSLQSVIGKLADAGLDAERAFTIFGQRGATAMLALVDNVPMLEKLTGVTNNAEGSAKRMADVMRDNLKGDAELLTSAMSELALVIGSMGVTSALRGLLELSTGVITFLSDALKVVKEDEVAFKALSVSVELLAATVGVLVGYQLAVWLYGAATAIWATVTATLALDAALLGLPITWVIGALALLSVAIYEIATNWEYVGKKGYEVLSEMGTAVKRFAAGAIVEIRHLFEIFATSSTYVLELIKHTTVQAFNGITRQTAKYAAEQTRWAGYVSDVWKNIRMGDAERENLIDELLGTKAEAHINKAGRGLFNAMMDGFNSGSIADSARDFLKPMTDLASGLAFSKSKKSGGGKTGGGSSKSVSTPTYGSDGMMSTAFEQMALMKQESDKIVELMKANESILRVLDKKNETEKYRNKLTVEYNGDMEKVNLEMQIYNEQQKLNITADSDHNEEIRKKITNMDELRKKNLEVAEANKKVADADKKATEADIEWKKQMSSAFKDAIMNSNSLSDALSNLANRVQNMLVDKALDSLLGGLFSGFAKGAAFSGGSVTAFASGGVVNSPTIFPMANGMGLMGEAGPEAVMPLKRDTQGRLGVTMSGGGGGNTVFNSSINIQVESSGDSERDQEHANTISKGVRQELEALVDKRIRTSKRPGGMLYSR